MIITQTLLSLLVFLTPLFFTTLTVDFYTTNKLALLIFFVPLLLVLWTFSMVRNNKFNIKSGYLTSPIILFLIASMVSTLNTSSNKIDSLTNLTGVATILSLTLLYILISNVITKKEFVSYPLIAGSSILSIIYILIFFGIIKDYWNPVGSIMILSVVLVSTIPIAVEEAFARPVAWVGTILIAVGLVLLLVALFRQGVPLILPLETSWAIAVDGLRSIKSALFGFGPGNFVNAFTQSRPLALNNSNLWNIRFNLSGSFLLQILTEIGLIGFITYLVIIFKVIRSGKKHLSNGVFISLVILFLSQLFLPGNILTIAVVFVLLGLFTSVSQTKEVTETGVILPRTFFVGSIIVLLVSYWFLFRWYQSEVYFKKSVDSANNNQAIDTYNNQIKAIDFNPYSDRNRLAYSQTNLALANAISQKTDLSDQDRKDISNLIQQSIREAKLATTLNPGKAENWENLALIYRNLVNAAQGADQWAVASYNQTIRLDPLNPGLRLDLGGLLYSLKNYDGAIQQFTIAINLKSNWANAHYNLSYAFREKGDLEAAFKEMQNTLALVDPNSNDFGKATAELEELRQQLPKKPESTQETTPETLTQPSNEAVEIEPKLELPEKEVEPEISKNPDQ